MTQQKIGVHAPFPGPYNQLHVPSHPPTHTHRFSIKYSSMTQIERGRVRFLQPWSDDDALYFPDKICFNVSCSVVSNYTQSTGTLELTALDSVKNWERAIRSVMFTPKNYPADTGTYHRNVSIQVWDSGGTPSNIMHRNITISPAHVAFTDTSTAIIRDDGLGQPSILHGSDADEYSSSA